MPIDPAVLDELERISSIPIYKWDSIERGIVDDNLSATIAALRESQANDRRYREVRKRLTVERDENRNWHWCIGWLRQPTEKEAASWEQVDDVKKAFDAAIDKLDAATEVGQ